MTKAQQRALEAYPSAYAVRDRLIYRFGYEQAEKDMNIIEVEVASGSIIDAREMKSGDIIKVIVR